MVFQSSSGFRAFIAIVFPLLSLGSGVAWGAAAPERPVANRPGMEGLVYGLFDDATGARIGRLKIGRVLSESGKQGFLRVAWRPLVVLENVTLELAEDARWPEAGRTVLKALQGIARDQTELRGVHISRSGAQRCELRSPAGRLRADGAMEFAVATVEIGDRPLRSGGGCFWLAGASAGQWVPNPGPDRPIPTMPVAVQDSSSRLEK